MKARIIRRITITIIVVFFGLTAANSAWGGGLWRIKNPFRRLANEHAEIKDLLQENKALLEEILGTQRPGSATDRRLVFVTSSTTNGAFGGLAGGDAICNEKAASAGLAGFYRAWLSDDSESPNTRFETHDLPYVLVDGTVIATSFADLTDGDDLANPINLDETGFERGDEVWTGTHENGSAAGANCEEWTSSEGTDDHGEVGLADEVDADEWSAEDGEDCNEPLRLYCFQQ